MAAHEDGNPNGRSLAALSGPSEGASYGYTRVPGGSAQSFQRSAKAR